MKKCNGIGCGVVLGAALTAPAFANHSAVISSSTQYTAKWDYVPDIDQRRSTLPNNGNMYCVPTSAMNWMIYVAHHGHPAVSPGNAPYWSWMFQPSYANVTAQLTAMGALMGTDPNDGTTGSGAVNGLKIWLSGKGFLVYHYWTHGGTTIRFSDIASWTLNGVPVAPVVGWYDGTEPILIRDGGHALSVTKVARSGSARQIAWRDPADDTANTTQSIFTSQSYAIDPRVVFVKGFVRTMDKVVDYGNGYIDGLTAIVPLGGLTTTDDGLKIVFLKPIKFTWDASQIVQLFDQQFNQPVQDVRFIPGSPEVLALLEPEAGFADAPVYCVNPATAEVKSVGMVPDAQRFTFGRNREVYFRASDGAIKCYPLSDHLAWDVTAVVWPPNPCDALTYDDATDSVLALAQDGSVVFRYPKTLAGDAERLVVPPDPIYPFEPDAMSHIAVSPLDGSFFITNEMADGVLHVMDPGTTRASAEIIAQGQLVNPRAVHVGDDGALFVVSDDAIKEFRFNAGAGGWSELAASPFAGLHVGVALDIPHSRDNFDPREMPLEEFHNELPTEFAPATPDCAADMNGDSVVDGQDLATLLAFWNQSDDLTDLNGDGTTDGADLAVLLASWGPCP